MAAEKKHQASEILLDAQSLSQWRQTLKKEPGQLEQELVQKGISSVAVGEMHLDELVEEGRVVAQSGPQFSLTLAGGALGSLPSNESEALSQVAGGDVFGTFLIFRRPAFARALLPQAKILFGPEVRSFLDGRVVWLPVTRKALQPVGLGFDSQEIERLASLGFSIWLRPENRSGLTEEQMNELFQEWNSLPAVQGVIFGGALNEAMGYPDL
ncbi:MAG: hypothetical protein KC800_29965, partial [Candidatus Eremiobacteraeota bacterium]|nr:hypothetical protein [Candidatus Eremiobacteraeota bacterium]